MTIEATTHDRPGRVCLVEPGKPPRFGRIITTNENVDAWMRCPWGYVPLAIDGESCVYHAHAQHVRRLDAPGGIP